MDGISKEHRSWNMSRIKSKDTSIEVKLRSALWKEGIRFRKNYKVLSGKPDIAITKYKIAIFCDSSFFHGRDFEKKKKPGTNTEYWNAKIRRNIERDKEVNQQLSAEGWIVLRFWDIDINKHLDDCVKAVKEAIFDICINVEKGR